MIRNSNGSPLQVNAIHASGLNSKMKKKKNDVKGIIETFREIGTSPIYLLVVFYQNYIS